MEIKLSEINGLTLASTSNLNLNSSLFIILIAICLGVITWYLVTSISKMLVIEKVGHNKKTCGF